MRPAMTQKQQVHRLATSRAMKRHAEARQCPACDRKSALSRHDLYEVIVYRCRWCGHEKSYPKQLSI